jgi:hypothetical protein
MFFVRFSDKTIIMKHRYTTSILALFLLFNSFNFIHAQKKEVSVKAISGVVTLENTPLANVNILLMGTTTGTKTDDSGYYEIQAPVGSSLQYSYVGLKTVQVVIEDITSTLNISMRAAKNELDAAVIEVKKRKEKLEELDKRRDVRLQTPSGPINPKKSGLSIKHVEGERLNSASVSLIREIAIRAGLRVSGTFPNERLFIRENPARFVINGLEYRNNPPPINISLISDVFIVNSQALVVIVMKSAPHIKKINIEKIAEQHRNQDYYNNDAFPFATPINTSALITTINSYNNPEEAYQFYEAQTITNYEDTIAIVDYFHKNYPNTNYAKDILKQLRSQYVKDPEVLKTIAYYFQYLDLKLEALKTYMHLLNLRSEYGQSHRDLANAYKDNDNYTKAWTTYKRYLDQYYHEDNQDFIDLIYSEMEYLFFNRKQQTGIKEAFVPKNKTKAAFKKAIRLVFEWNTSEAEFDLEFVGPDQRSFSFKHSTFDDQELINTEKKYGISSKEFVIEKVEDIEWLVNLTYYGNKKEAPTYLKLTTYTHWGSSDQKQEIQLFELKETNIKYQLKVISKALLDTPK